MRRTTTLLGVSLLALTSAPAFAADVSAAVAANFTKPAEEIGAAFTAKTGDTVTFSFGATGALYTQISQGAPFEVFFAADDKRTATAVEDGFAVGGTEFTYAVGKVVLYSPLIDVTDGAEVLRGGAFRHIAIADPATAPYGAAAMAVLERLGVSEAVTPKIVTGENTSQTLQFVESGSAELGFVALSQVIGQPDARIWRVPQEDYPAIRQNAVLLKAGEANEAAKAFLDYVKGPDAVKVIEAAGYAVE